MNLYLGVASKVLRMSIEISSVLLCGALWLKPSSMSCVSCVSKVLVECCCLKPYWVGESGICGIIRFSTIRSMTSTAVVSSVFLLVMSPKGIVRGSFPFDKEVSGKEVF